MANDHVPIIVIHGTESDIPLPEEDQKSKHGSDTSSKKKGCFG